MVNTVNRIKRDLTDLIAKKEELLIRYSFLDCVRAEQLTQEINQLNQRVLRIMTLENELYLKELKIAAMRAFHE